MKFLEEDKSTLLSMAADLLIDKNRIAKAIAVFIRNEIEEFHVKYLSDEQMREINPLIRNAIFTFLSDYGSDYASIATLLNGKLCSKYILNNTLPYLKEQKIPKQGISQFTTIINDTIGLPFRDLSTGGLLLAGYELMFVPKYWEDCIYCYNLTTSAKS